MRTLTDIAKSDRNAQRLLEVLVDQSTPAPAYRDAMTGLGQALASAFAPEVRELRRKSICVVCTVEDADYLAKGVIAGLIQSGISESTVSLVCFWNERIRRFDGSAKNNFDIAPVIKQYREPVDVSDSVIVVVKSIISGACVVRTNLSTLLDRAIPGDVFVASPVMLEGAEKRLASEFPQNISDRFRYFTFAVDTEKDEHENVSPGIGGMVYDRLGFTDKNSYVPEIVRQRRRVKFAGTRQSFR